MATLNPFDLLGDNDTEDPSLLIVPSQPKVEAKKNPVLAAKQPPTQGKEATGAAKLPSKPLPPAQAVREGRSESARGGRGGGRGNGRGRGSYRDSHSNENSFGGIDVPARQGAVDGSDSGRASERHGGYAGSSNGPPRGGRREGFGNGEIRDGDRERPRRTYDRRSGTGRGNEIKRAGAGRGNWGTQADEITQETEEVVVAKDEEKPVNEEKPQTENQPVADGDKEVKEAEEKEPEDKEMTLEEYEKILEEKRKALLTLKTEERKVDTKDFESMQQLSNKKSGDDVFIKLGSDKDKKKELSEKEDRAKKSVSINEFLKPAEGERYYSPNGRGRGRFRGPRGGYTGGNGFNLNNNKDLAIADPAQFPILGGN